MLLDSVLSNITDSHITNYRCYVNIMNEAKKLYPFKLLLVNNRIYFLFDQGLISEEEMLFHINTFFYETYLKNINYVVMFGDESNFMIRSNPDALNINLNLSQDSINFGHIESIINEMPLGVLNNIKDYHILNVKKGPKDVVLTSGQRLIKRRRQWFYAHSREDSKDYLKTISLTGIFGSHILKYPKTIISDKDLGSLRFLIFAVFFLSGGFFGITIFTTLFFLLFGKYDSDNIYYIKNGIKDFKYLFYSIIINVVYIYFVYVPILNLIKDYLVLLISRGGQ